MRLVSLKDKYKGCLIGLLVGDCLCAPHEGGPLEKILWLVIGKTKSRKWRYTDDSQMTMDLANHILKNGTVVQDCLADEFCKAYKWSRGYGPGTVSVFRQIRKGKHWSQAAIHKFKDGSYGNGAAMRVAPIALQFYGSIHETEKSIVAASEITHPNHIAITGAKLIANAIQLGVSGIRWKDRDKNSETILQDPLFAQALSVVDDALDRNDLLPHRDIRRLIGVSSAARESCLAALYISSTFSDRAIMDLVGYVNSCGGDTDTIGAMAGSIWGAINGASSIPDTVLDSLEGAEIMNKLAVDIFNNT